MVPCSPPVSNLKRTDHATFRSIIDDVVDRRHGGTAASATAADPTVWIPSDVNAVARVNVADIYKTSLAQKEGWLKKASESFIQQEAFIPPGTNQMLIGAELDLADNLKASRKYSVLVPDSQMTMEKLSPWLPGGIEQLAGKSVALFGNDGYVADAGDGCWLVSGSSSRQVISRWLKAGPIAGGNILSRYLRTALSSKENTAQVLLVIDLQDNFSGTKVREELKKLDWFKSESALETAAKILESVHGITIGIAVDEQRTGTATIEFGRDTAALTPILGKLVVEVLNRVGASSDELFDWKWTTKGNQVVGQGPVSPGGARRLLSILDPPSITQAISASASSTETSAADKAARYSRQYSSSLRVLLDDLKGDLDKDRDNHAVYFERYGRKIDDLPKLHVDSVLLDFGLRVSGSLRYQGQAVRMYKINSGTRMAQNYANNSYYVGAYASSSNFASNTAIGAEANQGEKSVQFSEWKQIEDGFVAVRRKMTEKYQIEF